MSEEEKETIISLRIKAEYIGENYSFGKQGIKNLKKDLKIALNLIDKLQKENEELKDDKEGLINGYKDTADKLVKLRVNYNKLQKELEKSNKGIDMCIDLLTGEGCLNFDTKQEKLDYIDKLIKLEVENEKK